MPRLLCLSTYPPSDASVRQRFLQYVPTLEEAGWSVRFHSIVGERLFAMKNRSGPWVVPKAFLLSIGLARRLAVLATVPSYDAVWIQREAFPFFTPHVERLVRRLARGRIVLDFDDALHVSPAGGFDWRSPLRDRGRYGEAVACADAVIVGSEELARFAARHNDEVFTVPTCLDVVGAARRTPRADADPVTIGWIGSWNTAQELEIVREAIRDVAARADVRVLYVGSANATAMLPEGVAGEARMWRLDQEDDFFRQVDIGIMPLTDTPWNRGKCAYKIVQYMAAGVPFVASGIGENVPIALQSEAGLLADEPARWTEALLRLALDGELRERMGAAGRDWAERRYDYRRYAATILAAVDGEGPKRSDSSSEASRSAV